MYVKAHGDGRTKLIVDQALEDKKFKVREEGGSVLEGEFTEGELSNEPSD